MAGLFQALEVGKRAMLSHQLVLQTIGHNIANVDTPGYTRQRVTLSATLPEASMRGQVGTGIQVDDIHHIRDLFLGEQYRDAQKSYGQWSYRQKTLTQIESLFNEPQDDSIGDLLNGFWDAWSELSTNSDSANNRKLVVAQAKTLINGIHQLARQLDNLRESVDSDLRAMTKDINRLTTEIARINDQIKVTEVGGQHANDLRDTRDLLIDELSNLIDVRTVDKPNGANIVYMGSMLLVDGGDAMPIEAKTENVKGQPISSVVWEGTDMELTNINGQLRGLVESRDTVIPSYLDKLNELTRALVTQVNAIHSSGYTLDGRTGINFFDPTQTDALTIRLDPTLESDVNNVVASQTADGDNLAALALSDLRHVAVVADNSMTIDDYYNSLVGTLGVEAQQASSFTDNYELLMSQIDNQRQSVQGVSLDEEMANLVKFQHAYDAAARVITTMDEALDTVIFRMGVTGR
jgi:flagellar hook-associated protein 1 FlgK